MLVHTGLDYPAGHYSVLPALYSDNHYYILLVGWGGVVAAVPDTIQDHIFQFARCILRLEEDIEERLEGDNQTSALAGLYNGH